jgi:hypothetical protein
MADCRFQANHAFVRRLVTYNLRTVDETAIDNPPLSDIFKRHRLMFDICLRLADHVRHYSVHPASPSGWEAKLEEDQELRQRDLYQDWHRVERAIARFEREVLELIASGWLVTNTGVKPS